MLIAGALFTVIITTTVFVSHFFSSFCLITVRGSVNERLFIDDFILIVIIQWSYCISSMLQGCLHGLYEVI